MRQATPGTHLGQPEAPQAKVFWYKLLGQWFLSELLVVVVFTSSWPKRRKAPVLVVLRRSSSIS